jgi:hypothetical protein
MASAMTPWWQLQWGPSPFHVSKHSVSPASAWTL